MVRRLLVLLLPILALALVPPLRARAPAAANPPAPSGPIPIADFTREADRVTLLTALEASLLKHNPPDPAAPTAVK